MPLAHVLVAVGVLASLAGCGDEPARIAAATTTVAGGGGAPTSTVSTVPSASTTPTAPAPSTTTTAPVLIVLGPQGIGVATYGDTKAVTTAAVSALLGAPLSEGPGCEPAGPTYISVRWPGITVDFLAGEFFAYGVRAPSPFETAAGIGLGNTVAQLQSAYGATVAIPGLPGGFGGDNFAVSFPGTDRQILGSLTTTTADGVITGFFTSTCD